MAQVELLAGASATNGAPTLSTDGVAIAGPHATVDNSMAGDKECLAWYDGDADDATVSIWGWFPVQGAWVVVGDALGKRSTSARTRIPLRDGATRLYAQVTAIGTVTSMDVWASNAASVND